MKHSNESRQNKVIGGVGMVGALIALLHLVGAVIGVLAFGQWLSGVVIGGLVAAGATAHLVVHHRRDNEG